MYNILYTYYRHCMNITSAKRKRVEPYETALPSQIITLNYGIEIECVFDIVNYLTVYIFFVSIFDKSSFLAQNISKKDFNDILSELLNLFKNRDILKEDKLQDIESNRIYIELLEINKKETKNFYDFFENKYDKAEIDIIDGDDDEYNNFALYLNELTIFIKKIIEIIQEYLINSEVNLDDKTISLLEDVIQSDELLNIENNIKFFYPTDAKLSNLTIYSIKDDLTEFLTKSEQDKLYLYSILDSSVECRNKRVYKKVSAAEYLEKYKFLLNSREFITQVFKTPDEIETKLKFFFENPTVNATILNCYKTSNHVHISFNTTKIVMPNIQIIITLVYLCYYYQEDIFKLFLNFRSNNPYCKKLNFKFPESMKPGMSLKHLNYSQEELFEYYNIDVHNMHQYNNNYIIDMLLNIFYIDSDNLENNRYFWLNIINLYDTISRVNSKPPTVEFRIKHGSTDTTEMANFCKLYANIINYAMELSHDIGDGKNNLIIIFNNIKDKLDSDKDNIYEIKILGNTFDYFKKNSDYDLGLKKLNDLLKEEELFIDEESYNIEQANSMSIGGGKKKIKGGLSKIANSSVPVILDKSVTVSTTVDKSVDTTVSNPVSATVDKTVGNSVSMTVGTVQTIEKKLPDIYKPKKYIISPKITNAFIIKLYDTLKTKDMFKINSFGMHYIGKGLNSTMISGLQLYLGKRTLNSKYTDEIKCDNYFKNNGYYYEK